MARVNKLIAVNFCSVFNTALCRDTAAVSQLTSYGPVQIDMDARDYSGCVALSNNSAELSAIPQILVRILMWRKRRLAELQQLAADGRAAGLHDEAGAIDAIEDPERPTTLVLVYDSQYTRDMTSGALDGGPGPRSAAGNMPGSAALSAPPHRGHLH